MSRTAKDRETQGSASRATQWIQTGKVLGKPWWQGVGALVGVLAIAVGTLVSCNDDPPSPWSPSNSISGDCNAQGTGNSVTCQNIAAPPSRSEIEVVSVAVQRPSTVDAELQDEKKELAPEASQVEATVIDVSVKNSGTAPAVILGADFNVLYAEEMQNCPGGGDGFTVSAAYSVKVPTTPPPRPFKLSREMRFSVAAGEVERFTMSAGPERQYDANEGGPWLYVFDVELRLDDKPESIKLGTVALAAQPRMLIPKPYPEFDPDCIKQNMKVMAGAAKFPAIRSEELNTAMRAYAVYMGPGS